MTEEREPQRVDDTSGGLRAVLFGLVLLLVFLIVAVGMPLFSMPEPEVNYVARANEMTKPENYDPNRNAALDYEKAFRLAVREPNELSDLRKVWPSDMNDWQKNAVHQWVEANAQALEHLASGSRKSYYWPEYKGEFMMEACYLPDLTGFKNAAYALMARARLKAANADMHGAMEDLMVCYKVGKHFEGRRTLVEQLLGMAIRTLAVKGFRDILLKADIDNALLTRLGQEFDAVRCSEGGKINTAIEKLLFSDVVQRLYCGGLIGHRIMSLRAAKRLGVPWRTASRRGTLEAYDDMCARYDDLKLTRPYEVRSDGHNMQAEIEAKAGRNSLVWGLTPSLWRMNEMSWKAQADADALVTLFGLLRYKATVGKLPATLQQAMDGGYLAALPQDPFGPGSLSYKASGDDFLLYSCGLDMDDDGGARGEKLWADEGDEVFWPVEAASRAGAGGT